MKMMNRLFLALVAGGTLLLGACGGEDAPSGPKYNFERAETLPDGYLEELGIIKTNIEVTAKLYEQMNANGYSFSESAMLSSGKSFSGSSKQAMGIGAIGSDMVYCSAFGQTQSAMSRMEGLMKTASGLGVAEAFDQELIEKMASEDTTINKSVLLTKAYLNAKDQLFSEERAQYATFMVIGGWLEGLHIVTQMCKDNLANKDIKIGVWSMVDSYDNVMHMCQVFESNGEMKGIAAQLQSIEGQINKIKKNAKKFKQEDVAELADAISQIRSNMY
jgi:hypothetical protein